MTGRYGFIRPRLYRYRVADDVTSRLGWNRYPSEKPTGAQVRIGRYAYCVRWARTAATTSYEHAMDAIRDAGALADDIERGHGDG